MKWDLRFVELAKHVSSWSKDPSTKVGAVVVDPNTKRVISLGYNGFPAGCDDSEHLYLDRDKKYARVLHAEQNALLWPKEDLRGHTLYLWPLPPCNRCALEIIQKGIKRVVFPNPSVEQFERWGPAITEAQLLFTEANVVFNIVYPEEFYKE